jgi:hypothetical protein
MCGHGLCHLVWILNQSAIINALGPKPSILIAVSVPKEIPSLSLIQ